MHYSDSLKQQTTYKESAYHVGTIAEHRVKADRIKQMVNRIILVGKYLGFIFTFYILMTVRVLPTYDQVTRYNPIAWSKEVTVFNVYVVFLVILLAIHGFTLIQNQLFSGKADRSILEEYMFEFRAIVFSFLITIGITFLLKTTFLYSRVTLVLFVIAMLSETLIWLGAKRLIMSSLYRRGSLRSNILIVGAGRVGMEVQTKISEFKGNKNCIVGFLDDNKVGNEVIGRTEDLEKILKKIRVDTIYITIPSEKHVIESMIHTIYKYDVDIRIIPEMFDRMATVFAFRNDLEYPCLQIVKTPLRGLNVLLKRVADICGSSFLLLLLSPLLIVIAIAIKIGSRGHVFFKQQRIGKNGLRFYMIKFRSMREGSEFNKSELINDNEATGPVFKMRNDPRVTPIGRILRKYSLDELPQLWNVLKGEMSLIGPRPPLPEEVQSYTDYHWRRMDVLPGMTGLWQVSGRSDLNFEQWLDLDIYYIERWSVSLEMKILLKTIPAVIKGDGAY
ncbi:sugar transferase [Cohnella lupini]|uniref:Exopolysaccharide biosynthesis polyprenyl glycosylphosphotransferase n=1 Tax=Cohnella lupini TaxID=1294267 RepID=A0A3D9I7A0_9BACL|nr:sugar transferase [Cohnella lupini]RED57648.1 exopolysaccharide biosynthesis polyprenyl glycosylphosphotransferase [Cohnella lupini]